MLRHPPLNHSEISLSNSVSSELKYLTFKWDKVLYMLETEQYRQKLGSVSMKITGNRIKRDIPCA